MKKWNIGWGTIATCNMKCQFCYSKERRKQGASLELPDCLSDDWFVLVQYIKKKLSNYKTSINNKWIFK